MSEGTQELPPRKKKSKAGYKARHVNGKLVRRPRGGARDTRAVAIRVKHGKGVKIDSLRLDRCSWAGRHYQKTCQNLLEHLGGNVTQPQAMLVDQAGRLQLAMDLAWNAVMQDGLGKEPPAFDQFLKSLKQLRDTLLLLGLERRAKDISLESYLEQRGGLA